MAINVSVQNNGGLLPYIKLVSLLVESPALRRDMKRYIGVQENFKDPACRVRSSARSQTGRQLTECMAVAN